MKALAVCVALAAVFACPHRASAQAALPAIDPQPLAGDCSITIRVPANTDPASVVITLDSANAPLRFMVAQRVPLVAVLKEPLLLNSQVAVAIGSATASSRVAAAPEGAPVPPSCGSPRAGSTKVLDEREVFEASGFIGEVFDNFAPSIVGGYANPATANDVHSRVTAGVESQYRLVGKKSGQVQLWLTAYTLHGMRTADAKCSDTPTNADCLKQALANPGTQFNYILGHASTIEAHIDARLELFTIQADSDVPAKVYVYGRAGFLDLEGAPRVYDSDSVGVGIVAPRGVFRHSYAQVGWGISKQYQTDQDFDRLKVNAVLVFDVMPTLTVDGILSKLGAGTRFFIAIAIDRQLHNGPDAVQTYIGADFDLRRIFGSF